MSEQRDPGSRLRACLVAAVLAATAAHAPAGSTAWQHDPASPGGWSVPSNWSAGVPTASDTASIGNGGTALIPSGSAEALSLRIYNGSRVDQSGGSATFPERLYVSYSSYLLSGTGHLVAGREEIYYSSFTHTAGINEISDMLTVFGGSGLYDLSGTGQVQAAFENVRYGRFQQSGGSNIVGGLHIGNSGTYEYTGGTLQVNQGLSVEGVLGFGGNAVTVNIADGGGADFRYATFANASQASLSVGGNSVVVFPSGFDPYTQLGSYTTSGITHFDDGPLNVPAGYGAVLSNRFDYSIQCSGTLTAPRDGYLDLSNGLEVLGAGHVDLKGGSLSVHDHQSGISGGRLITERTCIGEDGDGTFTHTDGSHEIVQTERGGGLHVGVTAGSSGRYELSGGQLQISGTRSVLAVGSAGVGTFVQTGGLVRAEALLTISTTGRWVEERGQGIYDLRSGEVEANTVLVGEKNTVADARLQIGAGGVLRCALLGVGAGTEYSGSGGGQTRLELAGGSIVLNTEEPVGTGSIEFGGDVMRVAGDASGFGRIATQGGTVRLISGSTLTATGGELIIDGRVIGNSQVDIQPGAALHARGDVGGQLTNAGTLASCRGNLIVSVETLTNTGLLANGPGSSLFVNALTLDHTGSITADVGGVVGFDQPVTNVAGQSITLNGGSVSAPQITNADGGVITGMGAIAADLVNRGTVDFFGNTQIFGDATNEPGGHLGIRNGDLLITGHTTNDGRIKVLNGQVYFEGGVTNNGDMDIDPALAVIVGDLVVTEGGAVTADAGSTLQLLADFDNRSQRGGDFDLAEATVKITGVLQSGQPQAFEAAGRDLGPVPAGFDDNFAVGTLLIEQTAVVLQNDHDNQPGWDGAEALYVRRLSLNEGASVGIGAVMVYYVSADDGLVKQLFLGDANLDGKVSIADLSALADNYGSTARVAWAQGDFNGDGEVSIADLSALADNYGSQTSGAAVPEPTAVVVVCAGAWTFLRKRRRAG